MQGQIRSIFSHGSVLKNAVIKRLRLVNPAVLPLLFARRESIQAACIGERGFESTTISDILKTKGKSADGSWLWCATDETVYDAVKLVIALSAGPLLLNAFIMVVEGEESCKYEGYVLAKLLFFTKSFESLSQRQWYFRSCLQEATEIV